MTGMWLLMIVSLEYFSLSPALAMQSRRKQVAEERRKVNIEIRSYCFVNFKNSGRSSRKVRQRRTFRDHVPPNQALAGHYTLLLFEAGVKLASGAGSGTLRWIFRQVSRGEK